VTLRGMTLGEVKASSALPLGHLSRAAV
jgi:hypothetical protein